jgi:hypothetical protein
MSLTDTITAIQKKLGRDLDGKPGPETWGDLNPACAKQLGLKPPFLVKNCVWNWV